MTTTSTEASNCQHIDFQDICWRVNCDGCRFLEVSRSDSLEAPSVCNGLDPYADKFQNQLAIGDSRNRAVELMGPPSTVKSLEVPLLQLEQLAWKAANCRVYLIHTAAGRVVSKTIVQ